jgi:predicted NAD-dependent protein-ADP-ribosyltransferase YbiA (DUF1768 family)
MPAPISVRGQSWPTVTQLFLAHRFFFDKDQQKAILNAATPDVARALAQKPGRYDWHSDRIGMPEDPHLYWKWTRFNILRRAIHERVVSDSRFVARLCETLSQSLVLDSDEPVIGRPDNGWGRLLEEMRTRLSLVSVETLGRWKLPVWMQYPEIARGSIGWRMGYGEDYWWEFTEWFNKLSQEEIQLFQQAYGDWPEDSTTPRLGSPNFYRQHRSNQ